MNKAQASHLFGPAFDALLKTSVKFLLPTRFNCPSEEGVGGLEGHTGLPALQPVHCPSKSCVGERGMGTLYIRMSALQDVVLFCAICLFHCPVIH